MASKYFSWPTLYVICVCVLNYCIYFDTSRRHCNPVLHVAQRVTSLSWPLSTSQWDQGSTSSRASLPPNFQLIMPFRYRLGHLRQEKGYRAENGHQGMETVSLLPYSGGGITITHSHSHIGAVQSQTKHLTANLFRLAILFSDVVSPYKAGQTETAQN